MKTDLTKACLGIELGSTRIKAVLIDEDGCVLASGDHTWQNRLEDGYWTYYPEDIWTGLQSTYAALAAEVRENYGAEITRLGAIGISAMMHGYIPFDKDGDQLAAFRTWRNTTTAEAAGRLTDVLSFNIPQRWTAAHLFQAILNGEEHVKKIDYLTTLAGYVHWKLTGRKVVGVGEGSGMFPIDSETCDFDERMITQFNGLLQAHGLSYKLRDIFPKVLNAGDDAGSLTKEGALLLDPGGKLEPGIPLCPPEGDAGTGMTATNSVAPRTGNVSAGTSVFAMIVLEKPLSKVYPEIDMVTTPAGAPAAMVHCNTCTSDLDAWLNMISEIFAAAGKPVGKPELYDLLYSNALKAAPNCGGLVNINYYSGEPVTGLTAGRPLFVRRPDDEFSFPNFARAQIYSTMATLKIGMDILAGEGVRVDKLLGHGGLFKTPVVGQRLLAGALQIPVSVMETAGEGGAWGIAVLASYRINKEEGGSLEEYLNEQIFKNTEGSTIEPQEEDVAGFAAFLKNYRNALEAEKAAVNALKQRKQTAEWR